MDRNIFLVCFECGSEALHLIKTYSNDSHGEEVYICPCGHETTFIHYPPSIHVEPQ